MTLPQFKASRFERDVAKFDRRMAKATAKRKQKQDEAVAWAKRARECYDRDHGLSRISGRPLEFRSPNPWKVGDPHHIVWRSAGGSDELSNLALIGRDEHDMGHGRGNFKFRYEIEGDANHTLTIRQYATETGRLVREYESPNPSA